MAYITLNKKNFFSNLDIIAKQTKSKDKIALVLKDNAYGHGIVEMATLAKEYGLTKAVVQREEDARRIYDFFEYILVLADTPTQSDKKIRYAINDMSSIEKIPKGSLVELKVNTGMNRNGIEIEEFEEALLAIKKRGLILEALMTHHGCADELNELYAVQVANFQRVKEMAPKGLRFHSCNSAALFRAENFDEDMARVGIAAYGCMELPSALNAVEQKPVLSLYADRVSSRTIKAGCCVGYGATFLTQEESVVSTYNYGYGDGFLRSCSRGYSSAEGVALVGRISMDNASFITDLPTLCIFSDARYISKAAGTISYEILTSLKPYIKRTII